MYLPFGYGTPLCIIGVLFVLFSDELGTDPRCFIGFYSLTKSIYFYYVLILNLICVIIALIVLFNLARPQTKRKNVIDDLVSLGKGTALVSIFHFILWICAYVSYMRSPDSESRNFYCEYTVCLGWFGACIIFIGYGIMSKRFRRGLKSKSKSKYVVQEDASSINSTRPPTRVSMVKEDETKTDEIPPENDEPQMEEPQNTEVENTENEENEPQNEAENGGVDE